MRPIKKSNSGLLLPKKIGLLRLINGPTVAYNKNQEKANQIEFELEKQKDNLRKLQIELNEKDKELNSILNINKHKKGKFKKTIALIETILKICESKKENELKIETEIDNIQKSNYDLFNEKSPKNFKTINIDNDNDNCNKTNLKTFYTTNMNYNKDEQSLPKIKSPRNKLAIKTNYNFNPKKKIKDILFVNTLRCRIDSLNDIIEKKEGEIDKLKTNNNTCNFTKMETDYIMNYNELNDIKQKNALMMTKLDDLAEIYFYEKEENYKLRKKLENFELQFYDYTNIVSNKNNELNKQLKYYDNKNIECLLYHSNKGKFFNVSQNIFEMNKSKLIEAESMIEKKNKELNELQNEIEKNKKFIKNISREIENIKIERNKINGKITDYMEKIENSKKRKDLLHKKYKELSKINKDLKNQFEEKENNYCYQNDKIKEIKKKINEKDEEIIQLKKEIEMLKTNNI
jgi:hypothetical protein